MALDLNFIQLYRIHGQEPAAMPGLLAASPPHKPARGREQDRLVVYLLLTGHGSLTASEYKQFATGTAEAFYRKQGSMTSALRVSADSLNQALQLRNFASPGSGKQITGWLTLACLRGSTCTFLTSGPMHIFAHGETGFRHIYDPSLAGRGLGLGQGTTYHLSQVDLQAGQQVLLCARLPASWEQALSISSYASLEATRRRLISLTGEDLNAVLIQAVEGSGKLFILNSLSDPPAQLSTPQPDVAPKPANALTGEGAVTGEGQQSSDLQATAPDPNPFTASGQPSAYAIPPTTSHVETRSSEAPGASNQEVAPGKREFPASIPRAGTQRSASVSGILDSEKTSEKQIINEQESANRLQVAFLDRLPVRSIARTLVGGIRSWRQISTRLGTNLRNFLPRLLPETDPDGAFTNSNVLMGLIAVLIPILVVVAGFAMYSKYGRSIQYESAMNQAVEAAQLARTLTDPVEQRKAWESVMLNVEKAESYRRSSDTKELLTEASTSLDQLLGILRLQFSPAFSTSLGIDISRMAASDADLFLLDAASGEVLHAGLANGRGFQLNSGFHCEPGIYGGYTVGPLVDILALPGASSLAATVLGVDATGNLLYCEPGKVAQAIPLPPPDTNWGRVTAFTLDSGNLYVLDAPARAVWVYNGRDNTFIDRPYFFFGGQTPEKQDVIDLAVSGDDLYMLHADGHLSICSYSRIETVPTRCQDPAALVNPFPASQREDVFTQANFTQMLFTAPPDQSILLLDADSQGVFRLTPRSLELQNQLRPTTGGSNPVASGPVGAMAVSPNHVLYLAVRGQVYFSTGMP